jgi:chaperonin GroES
MAIEKSLYEAPQGIAELENLDEAAGIEIEIEMPEDEEVSIEVEISSESDFDKNLAEDIDEATLQEISSEILDFIQIDLQSRKDWERTYKEGLELLGLKMEERTEPWDGACGVYHPILSEAVVKFQAETIIETFPASGPVKTKIIGKITREKEEAASRVREDMNYELTEKMVEYRSEHERLLWSLPIAGSAFKKVYFDPAFGRPVAMFITAEDIIVPYGASDLFSAPRITHRMRKTPNQLKKLQVSGFYRDIDLPEHDHIAGDIEQAKDKDAGIQLVQDDRYVIYEVHIDYDLPGFEDPDGIALPYVITIDSSGEVLSIRRNYLEGDDKKTPRLHFSHYNYIPGFGFYGFGLIHLVGGFAKSATSILRQLVDAGTLSNLPGGFKSKDLRVKGDDTPIAPGEWRDVDVTGATIKDSIVPLPYKEPSATLYNLLNTIVEEGRKFASVADLKVSDMSAQAPVGTTLAILERTLKVMSAVQARTHATMKHEFKLIAGLLRDFAPEEYEYETDSPMHARKADYEVVEIIPVSDPNASTMAQRVVQYQAALQLATTAPNIYDLPQLHRQMLEVLGIKNIEKIIPLTEDHKPKDPVSENMAVLTGKPVQAFLYQDHEAHLKIHMNAMNDPKLQQIIGQNPQAQAMQAALQAHISEHVAFQYRIEIEKMLGVELPPEGEELPKDIEVQLSRAVADASDKLLAKDVAEAQQQQIQQQMQDPVIQMQQRELEIKEADLQRKAEKDKADIALKAKQIQKTDERERERTKAQTTIEGARIGADVAKSKEANSMKQVIEGAKLGVQIGANRIPTE